MLSSCCFLETKNCFSGLFLFYGQGHLLWTVLNAKSRSSTSCSLLSVFANIYINYFMFKGRKLIKKVYSRSSCLRVLWIVYVILIYLVCGCLVRIRNTNSHTLRLADFKVNSLKCVSCYKFHICSCERKTISTRISW